jgi:hypothetical protein
MAGILIGGLINGGRYRVRAVDSFRKHGAFYIEDIRQTTEVQKNRDDCPGICSWFEQGAAKTGRSECNDDL